MNNKNAESDYNIGDKVYFIDDEGRLNLKKITGIDSAVSQRRKSVVYSFPSHWSKSEKEVSDTAEGLFAKLKDTFDNKQEGED